MLGEADPLLLRDLINRFIIVELVRSADEHLRAEDYLDTLKTKWALVFVIIRGVEVFLDAEDRLVFSGIIGHLKDDYPGKSAATAPT